MERRWGASWSRRGCAFRFCAHGCFKCAIPGGWGYLPVGIDGGRGKVSGEPLSSGATQSWAAGNRGRAPEDWVLPRAQGQTAGNSSQQKVGPGPKHPQAAWGSPGGSVIPPHPQVHMRGVCSLPWVPVLLMSRCSLEPCTQQDWGVSVPERGRGSCPLYPGGGRGPRFSQLGPKPSLPDRPNSCSFSRPLGRPGCLALGLWTLSGC